MREVALFENALLAAVPTQPDPRLEAALVPRLAEAARASTVEAETRPIARRPRRRSRRALVARVGIAVAAVPLVLAGLAFAGATVPSAARSAFDSVGITLPNQPAKHSEASGTSGQGSGAGTAKGMESPQSATPPATEKGNSAAAHRHALEQHRKAHGKAVGHSRGKAIGLNGAAPPGHTGQTGPPSHSNAGGSSSSDGNGHESAPSQGTHVPQGNANGHSK